jgi:hypothetical protein
MNRKGFAIAQNRDTTGFFTSSSSYDQPKWTPLKEATVFPTAELAQRALSKLLTYGAYSARIVEATAMEFGFPDEGPNKDQAPIVKTDGKISDAEMEAGGLSDDPEEDLNLDDDEIETEDDFGEFDDREGTDEFGTDEQALGADDEFGTEEEPELDEFGNPIEQEENEQAFMSPVESKLMGMKSPNGNGPMRESATMPGKPQSDAAPSENKNTVVDQKKVPVIKFTQDNRVENDTDFTQDIDSLHKEFKTPKNVMRAIKASIDLYNDAAEFNNGRDDAQASLALTVADALGMIHDYLALNTHEGLKQAQIKITTLMNPITTNFPPEVIDFLYKSGRQPASLKNIFYDKWDSKKGE